MMTILRRFTLIFLTITLCWTTIACGRPESTTSQVRNVASPVATNTRLSDGQYPVQQATYDDATGEYSLFLLNTPPGAPPTFTTANLQMARLTDEEVKAGQKTYLKVENGQPVLYLTEDFRIEYVHNVAETQTNPQTGQQETVIVRRETGFWSPFAGALAGQAIGSLLFRPQYYVPPLYQPGASVITGFGGYGSSYGQAVERYQSRYNAPPLAERNRRSNLRTTGRIRTPSYRQPTTTTRRSTPRVTTNNRPTGSGFGASNLRSGNSNNRRPSSGSFGSSNRSFGSSRSRSSGGFRSSGGRRR
ncbi:hypothetical protein Glo7428_1712 [Gloeocapsa sp. PCC 7428]|uniref:hypothetical protein n=1 Tax=Gloeocapsa sp. PCC 7428 TaxID=1173026 RepID=UPI0002A5E568|nr:hypothetical protein [Gloeocapsa sp. PCC 7428]AFZ30268.1 hypothetical protein Glo7428_1712 [Gloeocapsa sp. PCC 7428]